jgi:hypothetical protein
MAGYNPLENRCLSLPLDSDRGEYDPSSLTTKKKNILVILILQTNKLIFLVGDEWLKTPRAETRERIKMPHVY